MALALPSGHLTYLGWWREAPIDFATWKDRFPHHIDIAENKVSDAYRAAPPPLA